MSTTNRVLVTGASGFIGRHLCKRLRTLGFEVHGVSRSQPTNHQGKVHWWLGDVAAEDFLQEVMNNAQPHTIFHLAGEVHGARHMVHVASTFRNNLVGTLNVLLAAKEAGAPRVVLTASLEEPDFDASTPVPSSPYAASKWAASGYGRMFHALYGVDVVILRPFMVYGPGQTDKKKLIPYAVQSLLEGESPKFGSGQRPIDWIYVDDVIDALIAAMQMPGVAGHTLDVGSGEVVTVRELIEQLAPMVVPDPVLQFGHYPDRPLEHVRKADIAKTNAVLGWKPTVTLHEGLQRTVKWFRGLHQTTPLLSRLWIAGMHIAPVVECFESASL